MTTKITREYLANSTITSLPFVAPNAANVISSPPGYITINGNNFVPGAQVSLNNRYPATSVVFVDSTQLIAEIPSTVPNGTYDVYIIRPSGRFTILPDGLTLS